VDSGTDGGGTAVLDQSTGVFTAPRDGKYYLDAHCTVQATNLHTASMSFSMSTDGGSTWTLQQEPTVNQDPPTVIDHLSQSRIFTLNGPTTSPAYGGDKVKILGFGSSSSASNWHLAGGLLGYTAFTGYNVD